MLDYQQRVVEEQQILEEKLEKLNTFNQSDKFQDLDSIDRNLLLIQAGAMYTYNETLKARISRF